MPTWLDMIRIEVENLGQDALMEPPGEVNPHRDHVVADVDVELRKLYGLAIQWEKSALELVLAARYTNNNAMREYNAHKAQQLVEKAQIVMQIFWVSLKDTYELWEKPNVGVRKGWKVIWSDPEPPPQIFGILNDLFGRDR